MTNVVAFVPKPRVRVRWDVTLSALGAGLGVLLLLVAALVLLGKGEIVPGGPWAPARGMDVIALAILVGAGPYALFQHLERRRLLALDARLPDFLTDLASLHKAGLTLPDSWTTAAEGNYGPLSPLVRDGADQVRWNVPILTVMENFKRRIGTPSAERTLTVVLEAGRTGGNVPEVLDIAAANSRAFINLREQRARSMGVYTIITYVASVIFIGVTLALDAVFVPKMISAFEGATNGGLGLSQLPSAEEFRTMFYTAALVQAVGNGLVAGVISDGKPVAGLKHAWTMVALVFLGFLFSASA